MPVNNENTLEQQAGTVKWYHVAKGYGFITPDHGGPDLFVHFSSILSDTFQALDEGQRVKYTLQETEYGLQATQVKQIL